MDGTWFGFAIAALINMVLIFISFITFSWIQIGSSFSFGLWKNCNSSICTVIASDDYLLDHIHAVRVLHVLAYLATFCAFETSAWRAFESKRKTYLVSFSFVLASVFLFCSMSIFTIYHPASFVDSYITYGYSYDFGWIACILGVTLGCAAAEIANTEPIKISMHCKRDFYKRYFFA